MSMFYIAWENLPGSALLKLKVESDPETFSFIDNVLGWLFYQ